MNGINQVTFTSCLELCHHRLCLLIKRIYFLGNTNINRQQRNPQEQNRRSSEILETDDGENSGSSVYDRPFLGIEERKADCQLVEGFTETGLWFRHLEEKER